MAAGRFGGRPERRAGLRARPAWRYAGDMPRKPRPDRLDVPTDLLDQEIIQEQAASLGRLGRGLEAALRKLRDFDAARAERAPEPADRQHRRALVVEAGYALWLFIVQREACGLRDARNVMRDYQVPPEVQACQGAVIGAGKTSDR